MDTMDTSKTATAAAEPAEDRQSRTAPVGVDQIRTWEEVRKKYISGKKAFDDAIVRAEEWCRLRHETTVKPGNTSDTDPSKSAWLDSVIFNKHSDAVDAYPEPVFLPREQGDKAEAENLSNIVPVILQRNGMRDVWSDEWWQKLKSGTAVTGIFWDPNAGEGLGDIAIRQVDPLYLAWEPGIKDIQQSKYLFYTQSTPNDDIKAQYPDVVLSGTNTSNGPKYHTDDSTGNQDRSDVVDVYYHKGGVLHFARYVDENVLYSTENNGMTDFYKHNKFPFVFDPLFPKEGYPNCGFGYVELCKSPQAALDKLNAAMIQAASLAGTPRWFARNGSGINMDELSDIRQPIVHVNTMPTKDDIRQLEPPVIPGYVQSYMDQKVLELKETSGNRDASTGGTGGVTAASALALMQEAGNGMSRDMISGSYRAFTKVVEFVVELIRQFYDAPRTFRITGKAGEEDFVQFSNAGLLPQLTQYGTETGYRLPVFDIETHVQNESPYTKEAQNQLAIQLYQMGVFNPANATAALPMLNMMQFNGAEEVRKTVQQNAMIAQAQLEMFAEWQSMAVKLMQMVDPAQAEALAQKAQMDLQSMQQSTAIAAGAAPKPPQNSLTYTGKIQRDAQEGAMPR